MIFFHMKLHEISYVGTSEITYEISYVVIFFHMKLHTKFH